MGKVKDEKIVNLNFKPINGTISLGEYNHRFITVSAVYNNSGFKHETNVHTLDTKYFKFISLPIFFSSQLASILKVYTVDNQLYIEGWNSGFAGYVEKIIYSN